MGGHRVDGVPGLGSCCCLLVGGGGGERGGFPFHLIPHRITHLVAPGCPPRFVVAVVGVGGWVWVWLGGTLLLLVTGARARCWVLRRHLAAAVVGGGGVCVSGPLLAGLSNASCVPWCAARVCVVGGGCGCGGGWWVGVWLCVECCIVDASIFERLVWFVVG